MKIKMSKQTLRDAVEYHAKEGMGLHPIIESNEDLAEWLAYVLAKQAGYSEKELNDAGFSVEFPADQDAVILAGNLDLIETVRFYML